MKKYSSLIIFFFSIRLFSFGQACPENFTGTKTLYQAPAFLIVLPPEGYQPVFINHVGRHGARHLTKDVNTSFAYKLLQQSDSLHILTEKGLSLWHMVLLLEKIEKKNNKSISLIGMEEQQGIAIRMYENNKVLFSSPDVIQSVMVTKEIRTHQSAAAFLTALKDKISTAVTIKQVVDDTALRFFDLSPAYLSFEEEGNWQQPFAAFKQTEKYDSLSQRIISRFFIADFLSTISQKEKDKFLDDVFGFVVIIPSISPEIKQAGYTKEELSFSSFFSCNELNTLGRIANAEDYLLKAPGTDSLGIQVKVAVPLLIDYIKAIDKFLEDGKEPVRLRFAHAETIAPFAALLGIKTASSPAAIINSFTDAWKAEEVIPLSANIQWVLYRKSKKCLVKVLLNEKDASINGLATKMFPYYSWKALRSFYVKRLKQVDANMSEPSLQYLLRIK